MTNVCAFTWNIFILYFVLTCFSTSALTFGNRTRFRRQNDCGFICSSGQCIDKELACDGHEDCQDGKDETSFCENFSCRDFYFRCHYGACVPKSKICNRQKDCRDNSDESSCSSSTKNSTCNKDQFECSSGQCISSVLICNGLADCLDKSDESQAICSQIVCPKYTYRCDYGACISTRGKCNGIQDCLDNSDEDLEKCGKKNLSCPLPIALEHGSWELATNNKNSTVTSLPHLTVINYRCNKGYKLVPQDNISLCNGNIWEPNLKPKCLKTCPIIESTEKFVVKCYWQGQDISCSESADGTHANFTCRPFYESRNVRDRQRRCVDGTWDLPTPECQPTCGKMNTGTKELITSNEPEIPPGKYPWHAAIYDKFEGSYRFICSGTLLSERVILTAAHCVSDNDGNPKPKENYQVAVGKHFSEYNKTEPTAQLSKISSIHVHEYFRGPIQNYNADIALLVMEKKFEISRFVQPICLDEKNNIQLSDGQIGVVVGWYLPQEIGKPVNILRELFVPVANKKTCMESFPTSWSNQFYISDKMCVGDSSGKGRRLCPGSTGASLAFRNTNDDRLYIQGFLNLGGPLVNKDTENCLKQNFTLFTNVAKYYQFIRNIMRMTVYF